jgi:hypothetical protein
MGKRSRDFRTVLPECDYGIHEKLISDEKSDRLVSWKLAY